MAPIKRPPRQRHRTYLREWREFATDKSMSEVARMIGYDHSTLQRLETGQRPYNQDQLERLAPIYGCQPHDLISRDPRAVRGMRSDVVQAFEMAPAEVQKQVMASARALLKMKPHADKPTIPDPPGWRPHDDN
jgi:transcriptional regulator with XRE-family HTH domain